MPAPLRFMPKAAAAGTRSLPAGFRRLKNAPRKCASWTAISPCIGIERTGTLCLEIPRFDHGFSATPPDSRRDSGSNDIGLDRGQEGGGKLVSFERVGRRVLLVQGNESFRSSSANPAERRSVEDSFAKSILWGFTVAAETQRPRAGGRHRFLPARRRTARRSALRPGTVSRRSHPQRRLHAAHQGLPQEHRNRSDPHLRQ